MLKFKSNEVLKNQTSGKNEKNCEKEKAAKTRVSQFGCTGEVCANSRGEKGKCTVPKRLEKV